LPDAVSAALDLARERLHTDSMEQLSSANWRSNQGGWATLAILIGVCSCSSGTTGNGAGMGGSSGSLAGVSGAGSAGSIAGASGSLALAGSGGTPSGAGDPGSGGSGGSSDNGGSGGDRPGSGAGTSGGGATGLACASHDINIVATTVSGIITVNGAAITEQSKGVGSLALVNAAGDRADLGSIPGGSYSALVAPGTYDVYYSGESGSNIPILNHVKLRSGIVVGASPLSLDIDIPATTVATTVTLNGAALPNSTTSSNGFLELRKGSGELARLADVTGGTQSWLIVPGTYDLYYSVYSRSAATLPTNTSAKLRSGVVVGTSTLALQIDVPVTTVSVSATVAGAALTGVDNPSTLFTLKNDAGDSAQLTRTSTTGASSGPVVPGTYDLYYSPDASGPGLPKNTSSKLMGGIVVGSSPLSLQVDLPAVQISGKITSNGAATSGFGSTDILSLSNAAGDKIALSPSTDGSFSALVIPGTYDVVYDSTRDIVPGAPVNTATKLRKGLVVDKSSSVFDIDVPISTVSGNITLNGKVVGLGASGVGYVSLRNADGGQVTLSGIRNGSYSRGVVPGTYDVYYGLSSVGTSMPINRQAVLQKGIVVGPLSSIIVDIDVPAVTVSGTVTVNGSVISDPTTAGLARLTLSGLGGDDGELALIPSQSSDPAELAKGAYTALVIPGAYELYYSVYRSGPKLPGNGKLDLGCFNVP